MKTTTALQVYHKLYKAYGPQQWWPADSSFEMMIGAILTQSSSWNNVEKAIDNLKVAEMLDAELIAASEHAHLAEIIRPSGFFNQKAERLQRFAQFYLQHGQTNGLKTWALTKLRQALLAINGIGPETADSMLLYGLEKPVFVVDAYSCRIFSRLGLVPEKIRYENLQLFFQQQLSTDLILFQEYHALIVAHAKLHCRVKPLCENCPLLSSCKRAKDQMD